MSFDAHKNFAYSLVATAPSTATAGTSLVVSTGDGGKFPAVPFNATIWPINAQPTTANAEIVRVTAISTDTLTIVRGATSGAGLNGEPNNQNRSVIVGDQIAAGITVKTATDIETISPENILFNGSLEVWQRGTTFTTPASGTYLADRWKQYQEANAAWTFSQSTSAPTGFPFSLKAVNVTANDQCAYIQILEQMDAANLQNQTVSFSFQAMTTVAKVIANLRVAILEWTGTANAPTAPISAWGQNGTDPTLNANWTKINTPANLALANGTWTKFEIEGIPLTTAGMTNLAVLIWVDDGTITAADEFYITAMEMNVGNRATSAPYPYRPFTQELEMCKRYYQKTFPYATAPVQNGGLSGAVQMMNLSSAQFCRYQCVFGPTMLAAPTMTSYNPSVTNIHPRNTSNAGDCSSTSFANTNTQGSCLTTISNSGSTAGDQLIFHWTAEAEL